MPKITLHRPHEGRREVLEAPSKANLLRFLQEAEIPIGNACGGNGLCASCKVIVIKGMDSLNHRNDIELGLAERNRLPDNERIACQCKVMGDLEITTSYW
jgi:2Fe-2S ferredoxin